MRNPFRSQHAVFCASCGCPIIEFDQWWNTKFDRRTGAASRELFHYRACRTAVRSACGALADGTLNSDPQGYGLIGYDGDHDVKFRGSSIIPIDQAGCSE